ncbi:hypothetical protein SISNIDRAFT_473631 [Sistotremastrum niveocremeum HHB9708]|uniref:Uncharacterized protein n=1 Tax=Sistotremastrum niveocremeum HHB9708 TaxID=1314777 RepID=A0A164X576_9AGAM|nr:hypothetical protein SISNIDRAFT_473631 [Sistotremastrum niveocremeum HHB9708]
MSILFQNLTDEQALSDARNAVTLFYDSPISSTDRHITQGMFSVTFIVRLEDGSIVIVQLRDNEIDLSKVALARSMLGDVVPRMNAAPTEYALFAYVADFLPGTMWIDLEDERELDVQIAHDSMIATQVADLIVKCNLGIGSAGIVDTYITPRLAHILKKYNSLPPPLRTRMEGMLHNLDELKKLPLALSHIDVNKMNILVDPNSLRVTGLIDWEAAAILPLGMSAWCIRFLTVPIPRRQDKVLEKSWPVTQAFWEAFFAALPPELQSLKSTLLLSAQVGFVLLSGIPEQIVQSEEELKKLEVRLAWLDRYE